ncbi:MAG: hypothetical protein ACI85I_001935 [Arenicella sp.]|jgi:hypothetical protein
MKWLDFKIGFLLFVLALLGYGLFYSLPVKSRTQVIENSQFLVKGELISSEITTEIAQSKVGNKIRPVGVNLAYSYQFGNQKIDKKEFINWERLANSEKNILRNHKDSFCLKIAFDSTNYQNGKAFVVNCSPN